MSMHLSTGGITPASRRGACPSLATPMQTGDGLIVRLRPKAPGFKPRALLALCDAARTFGNGILDVTARGNLQLRGLTDRSVGGLRTAIASERLELHEGLSIDTPPLAGLDPDEAGDSLALAGDLRRALAALDRPLVLAPKLSVVIDGGGRLSLDALSADIRLRAVADAGEALWQLSLGGTGKSETRVGLFDAPSALGAVMQLLQALAVLGPMARARDLDPADFARQLPAMVACGDGVRRVEPVDAAPFPVGVHDLGTAGLVLGVGLAYGQIEARMLADFVLSLERQGVADIRLCPGRAVLVAGLRSEAISEAQELAAKLGFRVRSDDPANHIAACSGRGACASAFIDTHSTAAALIGLAPSLFDGSAAVHVSGCAKGCARPSAAGLTLVGVPGGCGLILNGPASAPPLAVFAETALETVIARLDALVSGHKRAGESAQTCLTRLQPALVAAIATERE